MGGSLSRSPREKSDKNDKSRKSVRANEASKQRTKDVGGDPTCGRIRMNKEAKDMERRDSKNFWISHMRKNSKDSLPSQTTSNETLSKKGTPRGRSPKGKRQNAKQVEVLPEAHANNNSPSASNASSKEQLTNRDESRESVNGACVTEKESPKVQDSNSSVVPQSPSLLPGQASGSFDTSNLITVNQLYNYFWDGGLHSSIFDPTYMLVIDARPRADYDLGHIILARSLSSLYSELASPLFGHGFYSADGPEVIANRLSEFTHVVVYGNEVSDPTNTDLPEIKLLGELMNYEFVDPLFLISGYTSFQQALPFMCTQKDLTVRRDHKEIVVYPSVILEDQIYLGRGEQATNEKIVADLQLTHVINIGSEHASPFTDRILYLNIKLDDSPSSDLKVFFLKAFQFISEAFSKGGHILIHCNLGVSRSSTIMIAYLMKSKQWTLKEAHDFVRDRRTCIRPNRGFLKQLADWEQTLFGKKSTDPDELWF